MSVSLETLEKMKLELKKIKDLGTPIKADLYSHLTEVFNRIMLHNQDDAYDKFEEISSLVKHTNFKIKDPDFDYEINQKAGVITNKEALEYIEKVRMLLAEQADLKNQEDRAIFNKNNKCVISNFLEHTDMLEWAGISVGEELNCLI